MTDSTESTQKQNLSAKEEIEIDQFRGVRTPDIGKDDHVWSKYHSEDELDTLLKQILVTPHTFLKEIHTTSGYWFPELTEADPVLLQVQTAEHVGTSPTAADKIAIVEVVRTRPVITIYRAMKPSFRDQFDTHFIENPGFIIRPDDKQGLVHMVMGQTQDHIRESILTAIWSPAKYMRRLQDHIDYIASICQNQRQVFVVDEANKDAKIPLDDKGMAQNLKIAIDQPRGNIDFTLTVSLSARKVGFAAPAILQNCCIHQGTLTMVDANNATLTVLGGNCTAWP